MWKEIRKPLHKYKRDIYRDIYIFCTEHETDNVTSDELTILPVEQLLLTCVLEEFLNLPSFNPENRNLHLNRVKVLFF